MKIAEISYYCDLNLQGSELKDARVWIVNDATAMDGIEKAAGKICYCNADNSLYVCVGESWKQVSFQDFVVTGLAGKLDKTAVEAVIPEEAADDKVLSTKAVKAALAAKLTGEKAASLDDTGDKFPTAEMIKTEISTVVSSAYKVKGSCTHEQLADKADAAVGDVWNLNDSGIYGVAGTNVVCTQAASGETPAVWDALSGIIDLNGYVTKLADKPVAGTYSKVTINAEGQVTAGEAKINCSDINVQTVDVTPGQDNPKVFTHPHNLGRMPISIEVFKTTGEVVVCDVKKTEASFTLAFNQDIQAGVFKVTYI